MTARGGPGRRRHLLASLQGLLILVAGALLPGAVSAQDAPRPNILFALADDWGWPHAGAYGDEVVATPTFDRLAEEGALFEQAFVSSPSCTPSRNAILTGQAFYRLGEGANLHSTLDVEHPTFVRLLEASGYRVGHWRKAWGPGDAAAGGYEAHPCGPNQRLEEFLAEQPEGQPFCFWFGTSDPHRGYRRGSGAESGIDLDSIRVPGFLPSDPEVRGDLADYYFEVQRWDREVGAALELLAERGELDSTLVIMTGDHGMPFPRCKGNLYDWGARVPLAMRWPERISPGLTIRTVTSLTDLAPTLLEVAGLSAPEVMTGVSLLPVLGGGEPPARPFVVLGRERHTPAQAMPSLEGYPSRALRNEDWLLILNLEPERWPAGVPEGATHPMGVHSDCDNGPTKAHVLAARGTAEGRRFHDICFGRRPELELYDNHADPDQVVNLADRAEHRELVAELREQLVAELRRTGDPRFVETPAAPFDGYPYRAAYLQKHLEEHGHR